MNTLTTGGRTDTPSDAYPLPNFEDQVPEESQKDKVKRLRAVIDYIRGRQGNVDV